MAIRIITVTVLSLLAAAQWALAAPRADLWPRWQQHDPADTRQIDHSAWSRFLDSYLVTDHPSGVNMVRYGAVSAEDRRALNAYLDSLQKTDVSRLNRNEQMAYWLNFYNALTVQVILDHYPVRSIRDINISPGFFNRGPWDAKLVRIEGEEVSLNDIEHRILRPIWRDPRIHYAVNCASIGCPNLQPVAFTAGNTEELLEKGARDYINHPRGARLEGGRLTLSSIYDWFQEDFGGSEDGVKEHLFRYAEPTLVQELERFRGRIRYEYDWSLNE